MSSYYTTAELEAMRRKQIMQDLSDGIKRLKNILMGKHDNNVQVTRGNNIELNVSVKDNAEGGCSDSIQKLKEQLRINHSNYAQVTKGSNIELNVFEKDNVAEDYSVSNSGVGPLLYENVNPEKSVRKELDFSELLVSKRNEPTKLEKELQALVRKLDERVIISKKDEADHSRVIVEISNILDNEGLDIEDKIKQINMRVLAFLQGGRPLTEKDKEKFQSDYYEYCALCSMLELDPVENIPYRVEGEISRMRKVLEKRRQDEYIMTVIEEIMDELGCHVKDEAVLDHVVGQMFSVDGHPLCDVFVGNDGRGIMFEPIGASKPASLEKKRQIENSASSVCALYKELEERAAEKGVILSRVYMDPANADEMCVQDDISERRAVTQKRKATVQRQKALHMEE
ncbi:hypothetical protein [Butyrivibrio sp.]|uniref:hypothetical protein n=1 Tax=Butyrivibrio sp. TaxID=28121 RepID=UPI0025C5C3B5|nr:hypothetical protein [Butyrivibrio sp.]MBE5838433.1 hypothetical protein [Butyrivibrio sp.]